MLKNVKVFSKLFYDRKAVVLMACTCCRPECVIAKSGMATVNNQRAPVALRSFLLRGLFWWISYQVSDSCRPTDQRFRYFSFLLSEFDLQLNYEQAPPPPPLHPWIRSPLQKLINRLKTHSCNGISKE